MTSTDRQEPPLGELFGELGADLSQLLSKEIELAKVEAKEEARRAARAALFGVIAAVAALLTLVMASMAMAWGISGESDVAGAFAAVAGLWLVVTVVTILVARSSARQLRPLPETTDAIKGAVTGERAPSSLTTTNHRTDTRTLNKETSS